MKPDAKPSESADSKASAETRPTDAAKPSDVATAPHRRDAADLARAAIERLRGSKDTAPRTQEALGNLRAIPRGMERSRAGEEILAAIGNEAGTEVPFTLEARRPGDPDLQSAATALIYRNRTVRAVPRNRPHRC